MKKGLKVSAIVLIFSICAVLSFQLAYPHLDGDLRLWIDHPNIFVENVLNSNSR